MLELYKNIKRFRKELKMSQAELAQKVGYTDRSSIAKIENGDVDLPQSKIMMFADALGVDAGTLMGNTGISEDPSELRKESDEFSVTPFERTLITTYRASDQLTRDMVNRILNLDEPAAQDKMA